MRLQINIENGAGEEQGSGPIATATRWTTARRLDRAGTFSFSMPGADPQRALCTAKRVARCYGLQDGVAPLQIGIGIIDSRSLRVGPNGVTAEIAGDDLLRELTYYTVGDLAARNVDNRTPSQIKHNDDPAGANTFTDKAPAFTLSLTADDYLYVGDAVPFYSIDIVLGATVNAVEATLTAEYWDGSAWIELDIEDSTYDAAATLHQSGTILFERMLDWATSAIDGDTVYWLRLKASKTLTAALNFTTLTVNTEEETATALADIMAFATDWTLDLTGGGFDSTAATVYAKFAGESVLTALIMVAQAIGEHFILSPLSDPKDGFKMVRWLRSTLADSGLRAVSHVDPNAADNPALVLLADFQQVADQLRPHHAHLSVWRRQWFQSPDAGSGRLDPAGRLHYGL